MFWNKPKPEPKDKAAETFVEMSRKVASQILHLLMPDENKGISPMEAVLHLQALNMVVTTYIVRAPDPQKCFNNFVEVLEDEVIRARKRMGR
jgi:hypothetical protein